MKRKQPARQHCTTEVRVVCDDGTERTHTIDTTDPIVAIRRAHARELAAERRARRAKGRA
jgi:hypothetical protein